MLLSLKAFQQKSRWRTQRDRFCAKGKVQIPLREDYRRLLQWKYVSTCKPKQEVTNRLPHDVARAAGTNTI